MSEYYLLFKALHIISVIAWMCGLLYLPRLFVYHVDVNIGCEADKIFQVMERRLYNIIILPAMIASILFGSLLIYSIGSIEPWLHIKLSLVGGLLIFQFYIARCIKKFASATNQHSAKFYRILNEIPTIIMIIVVFVVIFK